MDTRTMRLGSAGFMRQTFPWALRPLLVLVLSAPSVGDAEITTSITHTPGAGGLGTQVLPPNNNVYGITDGKPIGSNLFHSFGEFSIGPGDIAQFQTSNLVANASMSNILGRVTGGNPSSIFGTIDSATYYPSANLFLINPSGIVFGPHGSVNVGGSVSFTTAQYLRLFDGVNSANFYANPADDSLANSVLALAPVVDFGFLSPAAYGFLTEPGPNATITVQGSTLSVPSGQSISLVGGKVVIEGGAQLSAPSGRIHLATTASPGEFAAFEPLATATSLQSVLNNPVDPASATSFTSYGLMSLAPNSSIDVHSARTVWIIGGQLILSMNDATLSTTETPTSPGTTDAFSLSSGSSIVTSNSGADPGANVQITVGSLQMDGAMIQSINSGNRDGGNISINSTTVGLTNGASILSSTGIDLSSVTIVGSGKGGNITVQGLPEAADGAAHSFTLSNGATITSQTNGPGHGGDILIASGAVQLDTGVQIKSTTSNDFKAGAGGNVSLNVGTLKLTDSASIQSQSFTLTPKFGHGGNISIQGVGPDSAAESVVFSRGSGLLSLTFASGEGGGLAIKSKSLKMDESAGIFATTLGEGRGGDILLRVNDASLSGGSVINSHTDVFSATAAAGGTITVEGLVSESKANSLTLGQGSSIVSEAFGQGRLGDILVRAEAVSLTDGSVIRVGTPTDPGTAGDVTIEANSVVISGRSSISSQAFSEPAGEVKITADQFVLDNSSIDTGTHGFGRAGDVVLKMGSISLSNGATISSSSLSTEAGSGNAGNVSITASGAFTSNASTIATSAENARSGNIEVTAQSVALSNGAVMSASSRSPLLPLGAGNAGNIRITSDSNVVMQNSSVTTEASHASGGNIEILAPDGEMIQLVNSQVSTSVGGSVGVPGASDGGNITIDPQFVVLQNSQVIAQANAGAGGAINIVATSAFIQDPLSIVDASSTKGISGTVNIQSPLQNVGGELTALTQEFSSAAALLAQQCAARAVSGKFSTFVVAAREGLPGEPGGYLASPSWTAGLLGSSPSARDPHTQLLAVTGLFPKHDTRPIQLAKLGGACR